MKSQFLLLCTLTIFSTATPDSRNLLSSRKCKQFNPAGTLFFKESDPVRVSQALLCDHPDASINTLPNPSIPCEGNFTCRLGVPNGTFTALPVVNLSLSEGDTKDVYGLVGAATGLNFSGPVTASYVAGTPNFCFNGPGQAAYATLTYGLNCTSGTLTGCDDGGDDNKPVEVCAPAQRVSDGKLGASITFSLRRNVSLAEARNLTDNPYPSTDSAVPSGGDHPGAGMRVTAGSVSATVVGALFVAAWMVL